MSNASSEWAFDEEAFLQKLPYPVTPTNLKGVYAGVAPPDDFDPNTASPSELIKNGILWRRPTAADPPALREAWHKVFARKWLAKDRVIPVLEPQAGRTHILKQAPRKISDTNYIGTNWSGAATFNGGPYVAIIAHWKVPTVSKPPGEPPSGPIYNPPIAYDSASWVGLDGYTTGQISATDMLQAGIEQYIDPNGGANYRAWYNWYSPADNDIKQNNIAGFMVKNGDEIFVWVGYTGKTHGYINIANNTTGQHMSITLPRPPNAPSMGNTVEWIMEDPDYGYNSDATVSVSLAKFTPITFTSAIACNANGNTTNPMNCDPVNIKDASKKLLTQVVLGNETVTIDYIG